MCETEKTEIYSMSPRLVKKAPIQHTKINQINPNKRESQGYVKKEQNTHARNKLKGAGKQKKDINTLLDWGKEARETRNRLMI